MLFLASESARRALVEVEIEEVDDEPSLDTLQKAATNTDDILAQVVVKRLETYGSRNYAKDVWSEKKARVQVGDEWAEVAVGRGLVLHGPTSNEADSVTARGTSAVYIGNSYGGRGIFDS
ncbi:Het-s 218-289-domain-containing protein [Xylariaceae sp. FL0255]|nr:Het-s 218-289-domain-containing protein [Xylariaceae sp. FL0255]